jgi:hypothetical protein
MPTRFSSAANPWRVTIVSSNRDTLENLRAYLENAGMVAHCAQQLAGEQDAETTAVVIFPDDFAAAEVAGYLSRARAARRDLVLVAVTRSVEHFERMTAGDGRPLDLVVLPRPSFGWTILDSIRERATADAESTA